MKRDALYRLAGKSAAGITELGATLAITHCTAAQLNTLRTNAQGTRDAYDIGRSGKGQAFLDLFAVRADVDAWIRGARDYLKPHLGSNWNTLWSQLGFPGPRLALPERDESRVQILTKFQTYFGDHATHEHAGFNFTAARAEELGEALSAKMQTVSNCIQDVRAKRDERDAAEAALLKKLQALWTELETVLEPLDNRWLKFIDRIPGDPRVPERVEGVRATRQLNGLIVLDWDDALRAARYKFFKQVVGVDAQPVLADTVEDSDATLAGVPTSAAVKLQIVATNAVGDAAPSEVIELLAA